VKLVMAADASKKPMIREFGVAVGLSLVAAIAFYFSTKPILQHFDYTPRIALALMDGHLGVQSRPPSWRVKEPELEADFVFQTELGYRMPFLPRSVATCQAFHDFVNRRSEVSS
jgi:hypothetical protein